MSYVEWSMQGSEMMNCSCNWGCSCQFNAPPTSGHCHTYWFVQIERGHFGDVPLDGLCWGVRGGWPAAIHLGNGILQPIIDERADPQQRRALEDVAQGRETEPGALIWQIFATTVTTWLPTLFAPIDLAIDLPGRRARVRVPGLVEGRVEPIRSPVSGEENRVRVTLPDGVEFTEAEFLSGSGQGNGAFKIEFHDTHAHLARIHWSTHGVVR